MEPHMSPGPVDDDDAPFPPDSPMHMVDDDDDGPQPVPMSEDSRKASLGLSLSRDDTAENLNLSIGGLNVSNDDDDSASSKKRKAEKEVEESDPAKTKRRKRRKQKRQIVLNEQLELTAAQIRAQLADTSDIVRQEVHPSTWVPGKPAEKRQHPNKERLYANLSYERLFTRPSMGDDGHLAPELLELWARHTAVVVGKPFPYKLRDAEEAMEETRGQEEEVSDDPGPMIDDDGPPMPDDDDDQAQPMPDDNDDNPFPPDDDYLGPAMDDEEDEEQSIPGMNDSPDSRNSTLSFSLVNDLLGDDNDEDNPRQTLGSDELASNKSKWHKHTVQVFSLLKSRMSSGKTAEEEATEEDGEEATEKPSQLSYQSLSHGCTRRTAATVFLELLQLKTWDYVELDQDESFGDITILPGVKFDEEVPTK